ncbi:MAG: excinuclease ABC subunit A, partial [Myxococcota bacterium]|nr:excinuclease ABC subunit A [Myxococcota bacterium]
RALVEAGNTVLVVEHHLDVIASADHVVELGPEGGEGGGEVIFQGSPSALAATATPTGDHLGRWLQGIGPLKGRRRKSRKTGKPGEGSEASRPASFDRIEIEGARVHNLKNVSVSLPRRGRTVVRGLSGSGKSSLAFDLLFAEGQRRFLDCLSSYARQYINQLGRPDADRIAGIPPTVAIEQRTTRGGSRSLVANVTEIEPFLRLLFARLGQGSAIPMLGADQLADLIHEEHGARQVGILAPMVQSRKGYHKPIFARALVLGIDEVYVDGKLRPPSPRPRLRRHRLHSVDYVVGWRGAKDVGVLAETIARAARLAERQVRLLIDGKVHGPWEITDPNTTPLKRRQLDPRLFSPRTDVGGCPQCGGVGHLKDEKETTCPGCQGERLGEAGRQVRFGGKRLPELLAMSPPELREFVETGVKLTERELQVASGPLVAIAERCAFLEEVGLAYLGLDRPVRSLSGGEAQRIRLAAQLGAQLSGVLYVLDEPTIGLHPTDTERLLDALDKLQARDNGVVMVEHDAQTLRTADVLVDMGPGAGIEGGEVLVQGPLSEALSDQRSITGRCLAQGPPRVRETCRDLKGVPEIGLKKVRHHNLQGVNVRIPRERLTVVSGVSGSGKSSLIHDVLPSAVRGETSGMVGEVTGLEGLKRVVRVDDKPIGKNPRSTPATYVGIWDEIRKLFAQVPEARLRGYTPGRFSFNVAAGRCATCGGMGQLTLEMSFLPNATTPCEVCKGKRYSTQTLHVTWDGLSIAQVLELSVREALEVFDRVPKIKRGLALLADVGLGYLKLGQSSTTLSGGEAQRIKLVSHLMARTRRDTVVVLDEPSIGLHMADVPRLMTVIHRLVDLGATVVVIEHNTDVIREADWVIDLGPGGGPDGGKVVYQGPFEGLQKAKRSRTGAWIARDQTQRSA